MTDPPAVSPSKPDSRWAFFPPAALLSLALVLRWPGFSGELTFDEVNRWAMSDVPWGQLWSSSAKILGGNVLFAVFLKAARSAGLTPSGVKLLIAILHLAAVGYAYSRWNRSLGKTLAPITAVLLLLTTYQTVIGSEIREYALVQAIALVCAARVWPSPPEQGPPFVSIALCGAVSTLLYLPSVLFWISLTLALAGLGIPLRKVVATIVPCLLVMVLTLFSWPSGYFEGFGLFQSEMHNSLFKVLSDVFVYFQSWVWTPHGATLDWMKGKSLEGIGTKIGVYEAFVLAQYAGPIVLGSAVCILALRGFRDLGKTDRMWCGLVGLGPMAIYGLATLARGHPALYSAGSYAASVPFIYILTARGLIGTPRWIAGGLAAPLIAGCLLTQALRFTHVHPEICSGVSKQLEGISEEIGPTDRVIVHPGSLLTYVRYHSPDSLRGRLEPLGPDAFSHPEGWATLYQPFTPMENRRWERILEESRDIWLLVVPWAARRKDPSGLILSDSGARDWKALAQGTCLSVFRSRSTATPSLETIHSGVCHRVQEALHSGAAYLGDRYARTGIPQTTVWDVRDVTRSIRVMELYAPAWMYLALEGVADGGEVAGLRRGLLGFMERHVEPSQLVRFHGADSSVYPTLRYRDLPRPFEFRGHPPDIDSTSMVHSALEESGERPRPEVAALIARNVHPKVEALSTWIARGGPLIGQDTLAPDVVANANALAFLARHGKSSPEACQFIRRTIEEDAGVKPSVYYPSAALVAYFVDRARSSGVSCLEPLERFYRSSRLEDAVRERHAVMEPLSLAAMLVVAFRDERPTGIEEGIDLLLQLQQADGAWPLEGAYRTAIEFNLPRLARTLLYDQPIAEKRIGWLRRMPFPLLRYGSRELTTSVALEALASYDRAMCR